MNKDLKYLEKYYKGDIELAKKRLEEGEPIQYIIGNVNFFGYTIDVNKNVLIPRFETEELVENTIKYINCKFKLPIDILEVGTGSGCISIALKKELKNVDITATDISKEALEVAINNSKKNNVQIDFINTNIFDNVSSKYDCIISNPPYISYDEEIMDIVYNNEPKLALFASNNGLYYYEEILKNAKRILKDKYLICFEIGMNQAKDIEKLVKTYLKNSKIDIKKDLQNRDRMIFIHNFE